MNLCFVFPVEWCALDDSSYTVSLMQTYFNSSVYIASCPKEYKLLGTENRFTCRDQIWVPYIPNCLKDESYDTKYSQSGNKSHNAGDWSHGKDQNIMTQNFSRH